MTRILTLLVLCVLPVGAFAATAATTEDDKVIFAIGQLVSRGLTSFELSEHERQVVEAGFADGLHNPESVAAAESYMAKIETLQTARAGKSMVKTKAAGKAYRDQAASGKDTTTTASGIVMTTLKAGNGATPRADDQVKVNYEGRLIDGTVFDSSIQRGQPATFKLSGVVPCWTEALQLIHVGGKSRIVCPPELAYGDRGAGAKIPGGATLVFEVDLLDIVGSGAAAPAVPAK